MDQLSLKATTWNNLPLARMKQYCLCYCSYENKDVNEKQSDAAFVAFLRTLRSLKLNCTRLVLHSSCVSLPLRMRELGGGLKALGISLCRMYLLGRFKEKGKGSSQLECVGRRRIWVGLEFL